MEHEDFTEEELQENLRSMRELVIPIRTAVFQELYMKNREFRNDIIDSCTQEIIDNLRVVRAGDALEEFDILQYLTDHPSTKACIKKHTFLIHAKIQEYLQNIFD